MNLDRLRKLLVALQNGEVSVNEAIDRLRSLPFEDLDYAKIDTHRSLRKGFPEVILCPGKSGEQVAEIATRLLRHGGPVVATKANQEHFEAIKSQQADAVYYEKARIVLLGSPVQKMTDRVVLVVSAGTSDVPVAEEAAVTAEIMGNTVERLFDVGVAGIHRLLENTDRLFRANVIVAVAGMEGALPSVVAGLVDAPVIAVPTSVGYGASFNGLAALLGMLNSCSTGLAVVNIDNGFGAGYFASVINHLGD